MEKKLSKEQFTELLQTVKEAISVGGVHYSQIKVSGNKITGRRDTTKEQFNINIDALYDAYKENEHINTNVLKKYIKNRAQSPGYAILLKMGIVNRV